MEGNFIIAGDGVTLTATSTSQRIPVPENNRDVMLINPGPKTVRIRTGGGAVAAKANSFPIMPGEKGAYSVGWGSTHLAVISPDGDQAIEVFFGEGT